METVIPDLTACASQQPGVGLATSEIPANHLEISKSDLALRLGKPVSFGGFSAQAGSEDLVLILHPTNHAGVQIADAFRIYSGQVHSWDELSNEGGSQPTSQAMPVHAWRYSPGDDIQEGFAALFPAGSEMADRLPVAPGPREMVDAVASDPGAVGFIPRSFATPKVRVVASEKLALQALPRLILSESEPQGPARVLAACLQKRQS